MPKPVILAADDSLTVRKLIEISLQSSDFELAFALDGKECLAKAEELKPSLLLLDYILPDMKGIDICHALLARPQTSGIPVLLISGNGAAIRQTYENASNVVDYLTKPFAPNVLNAVVGHLLAKMDRSKAEQTDSQEISEAATADGVPGQGAPQENLHEKIGECVAAALRGPLAAFPGLEAVRENEPAADYFLDFLKNSGSIARLCQSLTALPALKPAPVLLRCTAELVPGDRLLQHVNEVRASGLLRAELADETIQIHVEAGEIVFISTNNAKRYCAGAPLAFRALPQGAIATAVAEQQNNSTPFFVTLQRLKALPPGSRLASLLQSQGAATITRLVKAASASFILEDSGGVSAELRPFRQRHPLPGLLLEAYRSIDDWLTIEAAIPSFETFFQRNSDSGYRPGELKLDTFESEMLSLVDGTRTVQDLIAVSRQRPFDLCRRLFPLVRLGLITPAKAAPARGSAPARQTDHGGVVLFSNGGRSLERENRALSYTLS